MHNEKPCKWNCVYYHISYINASWSNAPQCHFFHSRQLLTDPKVCLNIAKQGHRLPDHRSGSGYSAKKYFLVKSGYLSR